METVLDAVSVEAQRGHMLHLQFENGEGRLFDMSGFLDKKPFTVLKDARLFAMASVENGAVVWPGGIDIAPETLYDRSKVV